VRAGLAGLCVLVWPRTPSSQARSTSVTHPAIGSGVGAV